MNALIAAPTGFVGRQLLRRLQQDASIGVRVVTGDARRLEGDLDARTEVVEADLFDPGTIRRAVRGIDVAYYPIRFVSVAPSFETRAAEFARTFRDACIDAGVKRIVYCGTRSSPGGQRRLQSFMPDAAIILGADPGRISTVGLLAGAIIGPGSAMFEMVTSLVRKHPVLVLPRWTRSAIHPVALSDVVEYLARAARLEAHGNLLIEIREERMTVSDLVRLAARIHGSSKLMIPIPVSAPRLSALGLALATPLSYPLALALVRFFQAARAGDADLMPGTATHYFPEVVPLTCEAAIESALATAGADEVESRWTDSLADIPYRASETAMRRARYRDERRRDFGNVPRVSVFRSILAVGGEKGWFTFDLLWRVRGFLDKLLGGFGTSLGRRSSAELRVGDMLDVWRVVDLVHGERLLLEAQMYVFGKAWLEFRIQGTTLVQTASYEPDGLLGVLYWYAMLPFHAFIFPDMAKNLVDRAREGSR